MKNIITSAIAAPILVGMAACANEAEPDERVVDDTVMQSPADIDLPEVEVDQPEADTDGDPETVEDGDETMVEEKPQ